MYESFLVVAYTDQGDFPNEELCKTIKNFQQHIACVIIDGDKHKTLHSIKTTENQT